MSSLHSPTSYFAGTMTPLQCTSRPLCLIRRSRWYWVNGFGSLKVIKQDASLRCHNRRRHPMRIVPALESSRCYQIRLRRTPIKELITGGVRNASSLGTHHGWAGGFHPHVIRTRGLLWCHITAVFCPH